MPAMIHIGSRSFALPENKDPEDVGADIVKAFTAATHLLQVEVVVAQKKMTIYVNVLEAGLIVLDPDGVGQGFFHGFHG